MPQKPQDRAKEKRRLTRRLANWRATQELAAVTPAAAAPAQEAAKKSEAQPKK